MGSRNYLKYQKMFEKSWACHLQIRSLNDQLYTIYKFKIHKSSTNAKNISHSFKYSRC